MYPLRNIIQLGDKKNHLPLSETVPFVYHRIEFNKFNKSPKIK